MRKVIILSAVSGGQFPSSSPYLPITPDELADAIVESWEAGAAMSHYHARDPETGRAVERVDIFRKVATKVKKRCDIVLVPTTGGGLFQGIAERLAMVPDLQPEAATFDLGPVSMGGYGRQRLKTFNDNPKYPWEREYIERGYGFCDPCTYERMRTYAETFTKYGTKPEAEIFSPRDIDYIDWMLSEGLLTKPLYLQFVMTARLASLDYLLYLYRTAKEKFGDFNFLVAGAGAGKQLNMITFGLALGGHVRVGLEDALKIRRGGSSEFCRSASEQVIAARKIIEGMGFEVATPNDAREILGLKGLDKVNF